MTIYINSCKTCRNYLTGGACVAFPDEIPDKIWTGGNDHKKPFPGDHDIQYEPFTKGDADE